MLTSICPTNVKRIVKCSAPVVASSAVSGRSFDTGLVLSTDRKLHVACMCVCRTPCSKQSICSRALLWNPAYASCCALCVVLYSAQDSNLCHELLSSTVVRHPDSDQDNKPCNMCLLLCSTACQQTPLICPSMVLLRWPCRRCCGNALSLTALIATLLVSSYTSSTCAAIMPAPTRTTVLQCLVATC